MTKAVVEEPKSETADDHAIASAKNEPATQLDSRSSAVTDWRKIALQAAGVWLATRVVFVFFTYVAVVFASQGFDPVQMGLGPSFPPD